MKIRAAFAVFSALLACASSRADFIWDGSVDDVFLEDGNWVGGVAPGSNVGDTLVFGDTMGGILTPDVAGNAFTNITAITFTAAHGSYTIGDTVMGGSFSFIDGGSITNDSGFDQTINVDLIATGSDFLLTAMMANLDIGGTIDLSDSGGVLMTVGGDFDTILNGVISGGGGGLLKTGAGVLTLTGSNTYTGGTELAAGTIVLGDDDALGTNRLTVTGDATLESDNVLRDVDNAITIEDTVTLTVSGANDLLLRGVISGDGGMTVDMDSAADVLSLQAQNTFTGGMTLMQGTIVLGQNRALGAGDVSVVGDFTLESDSDSRLFFLDIDIADTVTLSFTGESLTQGFASTISGEGALNINLATALDEITLRGPNTYAGGTTLTMGTIILGDNLALGTGDLTLAGNGTIESNNNARIINNDVDLDAGFTLTFGGNRDLRLNGVISGTGGLTHDATAVLILAGDNTYTGLTEVNDGAELILNGTIGGSLDVNDGGLLTGSGSMLGGTSDLTIKSGGSVSPGASVGTFTIEGDYVQDSGGTYVAEIDTTDGTADLLDISGTATLAAGSTIEASLIGEGYLASGQDFVIIEADGGIFDNGVLITVDSATVTVDLVRDTGFMDGNTTWSLELLRAGNAYSAAADPGTNSRIAFSLDSLIAIANATPTGPSAGLLGQLDALNAADYNQAVRQLSPEPFNLSDATTTAAVRDFTTQQATYLAGIRSGIEAAPRPGPPAGSMALAYDDPLILAAAIAQARGDSSQQAAAPRQENGWGRYFKVQGVFANQDTTANRTGFDATTFGGQFGIDYSYSPNLVIGLAVGYTFTDANLDGGLGDIEDQTIRAGPYMSYYKDDWYVDASLTFGWHMFDSDRNIPALGLTAHSDYDGYDITGYVGAGYHFELDWNLYLTPIASVLYSHFSYDSFSETGAGGANLKLPSRESDSLRTRIGANISYRFPAMTLRPVPYMYMGWEHEFVDDDNIEAAFAGGGSPFLINVGNRDEDAFFIGGGVNLLIKKNMAAFLRIESVRASNSDAVGVAAGVSVAF